MYSNVGGFCLIETDKLAFCVRLASFWLFALGGFGFYIIMSIFKCENLFYIYIYRVKFLNLNFEFSATKNPRL